MSRLKLWKIKLKTLAEQIANGVFASLSLLMCLYFADFPVPFFRSSAIRLTQQIYARNIRAVCQRENNFWRNFVEIIESWSMRIEWLPILNEKRSIKTKGPD